jgi:hypothetical protein
MKSSLPNAGDGHATQAIFYNHEESASIILNEDI